MIEKGIGMKAILALEDGTVFEGISCGVPGEVPFPDMTWDWAEIFIPCAMHHDAVQGP